MSTGARNQLQTPNKERTCGFPSPFATYRDGLREMARSFEYRPVLVASRAADSGMFPIHQPCSARTTFPAPAEIRTMRSRKDGNGITRKLPGETVLYHKFFGAKGGEEGKHTLPFDPWRR